MLYLSLRDFAEYAMNRPCIERRRSRLKSVSCEQDTRFVVIRSISQNLPLPLGNDVGLMPARDRITSLAQVICQVLLHLGCGLERHWVHVRVEFWKQADAVAFDYRGCLGPCLVVGKSFFRRQPRHAHIDAGLLRVALGVGGADRTDSASGGVEQDHIDVVVKVWLLFSPEFPVRPSLHAASLSNVGVEVIPFRSSAYSGARHELIVTARGIQKFRELPKHENYLLSVDQRVIDE
jgi:hypothetical protein